MPAANGAYYGDGSATYEDYEVVSDSSHDSVQWKNAENGTHVNGHTRQESLYSNDRMSFQFQLDSQLQAPPQDEVGRHMLYESALIDSKTFDILTLEEVDILKKELDRLNPRIEAAQRKLTLEHKVRDAAQNLRKLDDGRRSGRADTPQNPGSPRKDWTNGRHSGRGLDGHSQQQADAELAASQNKIEELNRTIHGLFEQRARVERKMLRHTAAVLAQQLHGEDAQRSRDIRSIDEDAVSEYEPDEFDNIRDILGGRTINKSSKQVGARGSQLQAEHELQLQSMQARIEHLNGQLRQIIQEAGQTRGMPPQPEPQHASSEDPAVQVDLDLTLLEHNVAALEQEQQQGRTHLVEVQNSGHEALNTVGSQLTEVNNALHQTIVNSSTRDIPAPPPQGAGHDEHLGYLQSLTRNVDNILHAHEQDREALAKSAGSSQKLQEFESTIGGLWAILSMQESTNELGTAQPESFSLAAFSSQVQHLFDKSSSAREQQDILRRQIQQQRELNNKTDQEKDKQLTDLQDHHQQVLNAQSGLQEQLAQTMVSHASSEDQASQLRKELSNVENELEQFRKTADARQEEHQNMARQLQSHQTQHEEIRSELEAARDQLSSTNGTKDKEREDLEAEMIRLTTELTMAKAELDGAYGSRAERAREAQQGEAEGLKERSTALEKELVEMTSEFQELTRESLELERERSQLDTIIDGLRERCETLEAQLSDEKIRGIGVRSPSNGEQQAREQTSMMVLRSEFKKMMRDARSEGVKLLRAEQENRRAVEAELRRLRQANTPLRKLPADTSVTS